jgi:hypothetical protein
MFEEFTRGYESSTESASGTFNRDNALQRPAKPIGSAGDLMVLAVGIW